jgi:hypothetical protein
VSDSFNEAAPPCCCAPLRRKNAPTPASVMGFYGCGLALDSDIKKIWCVMSTRLLGEKEAWGPCSAAKPGGAVQVWLQPAPGDLTQQLPDEQVLALPKRTDSLRLIPPLRDWDGLHMQCSAISGAVRRMASRPLLNVLALV